MEKYYYYDGKTAQAQEVSLSILTQGLTINTSEGLRAGHWNFADIEIVQDDKLNNRLRLSNRTIRGARLVVECGIAPRIRETLVQLQKKRQDIKPYHFLFAIPMLLALFIAGMSLYGPPMADHFLGFIPTTVDEKIGELAESQLVEDITLCADDAAEAALNKILERLLETVDTPFTFRVDIGNDDTVNAFALPGGHIVIYGGLINQADTSEELAGVLAHEMAHVIKRHGVAGLAKQLGLQAILLAATGDTNSVINFGHTLLSMSMSRTQEAEADAVGADMLAKAGISVKGFQAFFERLSRSQSDYGVLNLLSTHPHGEDRAKALTDPPGFVSRPLLTNEEWTALKGYCGEDDGDL